MQTSSSGFSLDVAADELDRLVGLQFELSARQFAQANFGAGQVDQDADRPIQIFADLADHAGRLGVLGDAAVRHVKPENVDAGSDQNRKLLRAAAGRPDGGDNFGARPLG